MVLRKSQKRDFTQYLRRLLSLKCVLETAGRQKNRERPKKHLDPCGECGKQTEGKADCQLHAPKLRVSTTESRVENTARTERQEKNFEIKIELRERGARTFFLLASATQTFSLPFSAPSPSR